jgi:hypothetical protein
MVFLVLFPLLTFYSFYKPAVSLVELEAFKEIVATLAPSGL